MNTVGVKANRLPGAVRTLLLYSAAAVALGMALPRYEAAFFPELTAPIGAGPAIALLSAIASGMLPLTGLVFSLAFVMVQVSATAYSPRLVTWFAGSATMSHSPILRVHGGARPIDERRLRELVRLGTERKDALEEDRQGLGLSREQRQE